MAIQSASAAGIVMFLGRLGWSEDQVLTPSQTKGPFYPIPDIEKQEYFDVDLTRKGPDSPVATGKIIAIGGTVIGIDEQPLKHSIVEVWQACETGRYNHPGDKNTQPLDPNFQYWGRMETNENGEFRFKSILPGKYPGRTPHIHFRIMTKNRPELVTQLYFAEHDEWNRKDSLYTSLKEPQRKAVTVGFEMKPIDPTNTKSETIPTGRFTIVMGDSKDSKTTPPM